MNLLKALSRRSMFWIFFFFGMINILINVMVYAAVKIISLRLTMVQQGELSDYKALAGDASQVLELIQQYYLPATIGFFLLAAILLWLCNRLSMASAIKKAGMSEPGNRKSGGAKKDDPEAARQKELQDRRLFVHLMTVLQREGRLMDFLDEDLEEYEDDEIGAAVRTIHEKCKKTVDNYLKAEPILDEEEDDAITVEAGFDLNRIKLVGNVTGEPPFKGIVRHRGWRAGKMEIPSLSGSAAPEIIAPAEVEVE